MVKAFLLQQAVVRAALDDLAVVDHQHLVGIADGGKPVGDHEAGAAFHQAQQGFLQVFLGARIDVAGGLVQDQDIRVGQDRPGQSPAAGAAPGSGCCRARSARSGSHAAGGG